MFLFGFLQFLQVKSGMETKFVEHCQLHYALRHLMLRNLLYLQCHWIERGL
jgi:hypothetical protein